MSLWSTIEETPGQKKASIVLTEGATISINAPADKVFGIITGFSNYAAWNTWSPSFEFPGGEEVKVGSHGTLLAKMEAQNRDYQIPVEVLSLSFNPEQYELAWRGLLMPSWLAISERVQRVIPAIDGKSCEVKNWESMSGWGSYILKNAMGIPKQLQDANMKYLNDLKSYAEKEYSTSV